MPREKFQALTEQMFYILLCLKDECCGMDIMSRVDQLTLGRVRVGPGTLYAMLAKFEEKGIIRLTAADGRRKSYVITDEGKIELQKEFERLKTLVSDGAFYFG